MNAIYMGRPLIPGERIPGTALIFVRAVLPRRGEFRCDCGKSEAYPIYKIEQGKQKSCGCRYHRRNSTT